MGVFVFTFYVVISVFLHGHVSMFQGLWFCNNRVCLFLLPLLLVFIIIISIIIIILTYSFVLPLFYVILVVSKPQYHQLNVEEHLTLCSNSEFRIFRLLQMCSKIKIQNKTK